MRDDKDLTSRTGYAGGKLADSEGKVRQVRSLKDAVSKSNSKRLIPPILLTCMSVYIVTKN